MKILKFITFTFCVLTFALFYGCATAPLRRAPEVKERIISVDGQNYVSLLELIQNADLDYEYDSFIRSVTLSNDTNVLSFILDRNFALSNGKVLKLSSSPLIEQGEVLIPLELRENIIASWLPKEMISIKRPVIFNIKKVVVDVGHGGKDPGAIGRNGLREKDVNLAIAKYLRDELERNGIEVITTRENDTFIPLLKRSEIANESGADLFISIHANAHRDRSISGFEVYYLSSQIDDHQRASASINYPFPQKEDMSFEGSNSSDLKTIVWDIIYTGNRKESLALAKEISKIVGSEAGLKSRGMKAARFSVLMNTRIPAILIELGFLSNSTEERNLNNRSYRKKLAESLARSILSHSNILAKK